jgi:hypothetical protein
MNYSGHDLSTFLESFSISIFMDFPFRLLHLDPSIHLPTREEGGSPSLFLLRFSLLLLLLPSLPLPPPLFSSSSSSSFGFLIVFSCFVYRVHICDISTTLSTYASTILHLQCRMHHSLFSTGARALHHAQSMPSSSS